MGKIVDVASPFAYRDDSRSEQRNYAKAPFFRVPVADDTIVPTYRGRIRIATTGINWLHFRDRNLLAHLLSPMLIRRGRSATLITHDRRLFKLAEISALMHPLKRPVETSRRESFLDYSINQVNEERVARMNNTYPSWSRGIPCLG